MGSHLGGPWLLFLFYLVRLGWAGTALQTGAHGLCPLQLVSTAEGMQGGPGRGRLIWAEGPVPALQIAFPGLSFLARVHVLSAVAFSPGGSTGGS